MGQKVNPKIFRIGTLYSWDSKWFSKKDYPRLLKEDMLIKIFLIKELKDGAVTNIEIERSANNITIIIHSAKPGVIIGRGGQGIEELKKKIKNKFLPSKASLNLNIMEVSNPNLSAELIVQSVVADLEKRIPFRRVIKQAISRVEKAGAKGVKITVSGRLNGNEIARSETLGSGRLPLHTLRADIDYAAEKALTTYGTVGAKVWIYKGEKFRSEEQKNNK